jgi:hypothetical protein
VCVANLYANAGKSDPDSYSDIHGNAHCDRHGDADVHADDYSHSYSYRYIHNHAQCYGNGYSYSYRKADTHCETWYNTKGASYATAAPGCAKINLLGRDRRPRQRERTAQRSVPTISGVRKVNGVWIRAIGPVTRVIVRRIDFA